MKHTHLNEQIQFIELFNDEFLFDQRNAGKILSSIMLEIDKLVKTSNNLNCLDIDLYADELITKANAKATFKGYKGFPNATCISVNNELVHGIPKDYILKEKDIISIDFGVTVNESIVDSAITLYYKSIDGKANQMINDCQQSLYDSIRAIKPGKNLGAIGSTIGKYATKWGIVTELSGHGVGRGKVHAQPIVKNWAHPQDGVVLQAGMVLAIEPLFTFNKNINTVIDKDGWTVTTNSLNCHWEHTIFIHNDRIEILTHRDNESIPKEIYYET